MIRRPPRSTLSSSSAASDVYKRQALRKIIKKIEVQQHAKYICPFCGKNNVKRSCVGIWRCRSCKKLIAGGAWELATSSALQAKNTMVRLKKLKQEVKEKTE
eukprot:TRINITY_DN493_c0_g1_i6.p1 TRINITY_DN493_c0_g1~~TRINITY_DN493_c0_g1_i6.p1  ORF type:complete len:102 (-),score=27.74 TRINITY_DN493_c0_g1_i6:85-390(-)